MGSPHGSSSSSPGTRYDDYLDAIISSFNNAARNKFAAEYSVLGTIWEAHSPDPRLSSYVKDFKWLTQVYESVKPVSGNGRLLRHRLVARTSELMNQNVRVEAVRDDIEALVLDSDVLGGILLDACATMKRESTVTLE